MEVTETQHFYVASFFPNAEEVEIEDKPEKGYRAVIGRIDGDHVVMKVSYAKDRFSLEEAIALAKNIKECAICKRLDAEVGTVKKISLQDQTTSPIAVAPVQAAPSAGPAIFNTGRPLEDMISRLRFDTALNSTGKAIAALALGDDELAREVMPTDTKGVVALVADLTAYATGNGNLYRSPKEVEAYIKALRDGNKSADDVEKEKKTNKAFVKRAATVVIS